MVDIDAVGVFLGLDVGKQTHHGRGLTPAGKKVFDKQLPNSEPKLRAVFDKLTARFGTVLVVVDQPASIGALPLTVARDAGCQVAYLPGLAMRRIADLYPGEAKTDAKDAAVIADAARTMPHTRFAECLRGSVALEEPRGEQAADAVGGAVGLACEVLVEADQHGQLRGDPVGEVEGAQGPPQAGRGRPPEGTVHGRAAGRRHLHRARRTNHRQ